MYGYQPPKDPDEKASWREILELSWIAMSIVLPAVGVVIGVMLLVALFFLCLSIHPALTLIPIGIMGAGVGVVMSFFKT